MNVKNLIDICLIYDDTKEYMLRQESGGQSDYMIVLFKARLFLSFAKGLRMNGEELRQKVQD